MEKDQRILQMENSCIVEVVNKAKGMVVYWSKKTKVMNIYKTTFVIEIQIEDQGAQCDWWFIGFYASCDK
mgnify:FL=1